MKYTIEKWNPDNNVIGWYDDEDEKEVQETENKNSNRATNKAPQGQEKV